jgi:LysM repeat protein
MEAERREIVVVVKEGETLSQIAERHGVSVAELRSWNRLDLKKPIHPGMRLTVQVRTSSAPESEP